jgi:hypothetical protein
MIRHGLSFSRIPGKFAVCRLWADAPVPEWAWSGPFTSVTRTANELSIVCAADRVPVEHQPKSLWACFKLEGPFAFSEVGILGSVIGPLAASGVPIFAVSTFDTDYVLVGEENVEIALLALRDAGHRLVS